jgi:rare lipoprotein A
VSATFGKFRERRQAAKRITTKVAALSIVCVALAVALVLVGVAAQAYVERCEGSFYGPGFYGNKTASGETFTGEAGTAAHPWLPFGTIVHVKNLVTGAEGDVRINDRGPYAAGRCIDVSEGSSYLVSDSVAPVEISTGGGSASASASASASPAPSEASGGGGNAKWQTKASFAGVYVVKAGDTFYLIAETLGVSVDYLISANPHIEDPNLIYVGDEIYY